MIVPKALYMLLSGYRREVGKIRNFITQSRLAKTFVACVAMTCMVACSPMTKESYLKKYDGFITEVSENYKDYDEKAWAKHTEKYEKFSGEWHEKFKDEFTLQEKLKITGLQVKFNYYSTLSQTSSMFKDILDVLNAQEIKKIVQSYKDDGMVAELEQLYREACETGKAAEKAITEILKELQIDIEELQK